MVKWTPRVREEFLKHLRKTGNATASARAVGLSRARAYTLKYQDEKFSKAWDDAIEESIDLLLEEARRRAEDGTLKPVFYKGAKVGAIREYSDLLLIFLIKGKRPEYATERRELSGREGGSISVAANGSVEVSPGPGILSTLGALAFSVGGGKEVDAPVDGEE